MLKGIDISNWQKNLIPSNLDIDFCICKATEGDYFVDKFCDAFIQNCKAKGILYGFYHFAGTANPAKEAAFFYDNCKGYVGEGVPVLDYEVWNENADDVAWCEKFLEEYQRLSGVWPILYISAYRCAEFSNSWIPSKCGLWVAGYPTTMQDYPLIDEYGEYAGGSVKKQTQAKNYNLTVDMPYVISPWEFAAIWQFTSGLQLPGYNGNLDGDIAFMDETAWGKYAGAKIGKHEETAEKPAKKKVSISLDGKKYSGYISEK